MVNILTPCIDNKGNLTPIEFADLPFIPCRIFYVNNVPAGVLRGCHAHYKTRQLLICIKGIIEVNLDDAFEQHTETLTEGKSILIDAMIWDSQRFMTGNDVLLVLCNTPYDKSDYITDYKKFVKLLRNK